MRLRLFLLPLLLAAAPAAADDERPDPAVDVRHYTFALSLSDDTDAIRGEAAVRFRFRADGVEAVVLDLVGREGETGMRVNAVTAEDGAALAYTHEAGRLRIRLATPARAGEERTVVVAYEGVPADGLIISENKYGDRTFFGDNWPNRARHWLPSVDHPSDKATCDFVVTAPLHYQVVGSGRLVEETDLGDGRRLTHWRTAVPLATKVMVVGAARFAVQHVDEYAGVPIQSWVYPQDRAPGFFDFARAEPILVFFTSRIGPFPYEKLANVQSKTRYGGMENASNIFYSERAVTGTRSNEGLLAHEIAHQWFGDSVTEADWHHVWLSEGFATYFTQLYFEHAYGRDRLAAGMAGAREAVVAYARRAPASPVVDTTIADLNALLSPNSYQKGAWVLHMLRQAVGDEAFWDGIVAYYRQYRDGNALTADFRRVMEAASGQDLGAFFDQWVHRPGHPVFAGTWSYAAGTLTLTLEQTQPGPAFDVALELGLYAAGARLPAVETLDVSARRQTFTLPLDAAPEAVVLDPNVELLMEGGIQPR